MYYFLICSVMFIGNRLFVGYNDLTEDILKYDVFALYNSTNGSLKAIYTETTTI